LAKKSNQDKQQ